VYRIALPDVNLVVESRERRGKMWITGAAASLIDR